MPVDADPIVALRGFRLDEECDDDETPVATFAIVTAPERFYLSHFSTCFNADQHRRPR